MRVILLICLFSLAASAKAQDKRFQFYYQNGNNFYYASYESVRFFDLNNREILTNVTDKVGRVLVQLPVGTYTCKIMYRKKEYTFRTQVDNQSKLRKVYFRDSKPVYIHWGEFKG